MTEDVLLEKIGTLIDTKLDEKLEPIKKDLQDVKQTQQEQGKDIKEVKEDVKTLDLKVAIIHEDNKKEHSQLLNMLYESNEINYKVLKEELKKLEDRITHLEKHQHTPKN